MLSNQVLIYKSSAKGIW